MVPNREALRARCMPEYQQAAGEGDPALVLPIYTLARTRRSRSAFNFKEPATVALTGVDDALADIHLQSDDDERSDQVRSLRRQICWDTAHSGSSKQTLMTSPGVGQLVAGSRPRKTVIGRWAARSSV